VDLALADVCCSGGGGANATVGRGTVDSNKADDNIFIVVLFYRMKGVSQQD